MRRCDLGRLLGLAMLIVLASFAGRAAADEIRWREDPAQAWKHSADTGRPMFIYATMDGCVHCKRMEQSTFSDSTVQSRINSRFVPIYMPLERHEQLIERWRITTFPTMLMVAPDGKVLARIKGFAAAEELMRQSQAALNAGEEVVVETAKANGGPARR